MSFFIAYYKQTCESDRVSNSDKFVFKLSIGLKGLISHSAGRLFQLPTRFSRLFNPAVTHQVSFASQLVASFFAKNVLDCKIWYVGA